MSTHLKDKEEKIRQVLAKLVEESAKGTPIIVEGKKDMEALRALGVEGPALTVKTGGKSFFDAVSEIECLGARRVVLLLDFDRRGKEGTKRLKQDLECKKIKPNLEFWRALAGLVGRDVQCVEGISAYLVSLRIKIGES